MLRTAKDALLLCGLPGAHLLRKPLGIFHAKPSTGRYRKLRTSKGHSPTSCPSFQKGEPVPAYSAACCVNVWSLCSLVVVTNSTVLNNKSDGFDNSSPCGSSSSRAAFNFSTSCATCSNLAMNPATHSGTNGGGSRRRSALADPRVVFGGVKPLSSRIMGPWRGSRSYTPSTPLAGGWGSTARRSRASAPTGTWRVCTAEGRRARCRASGWTSSPIIGDRAVPTV